MADEGSGDRASELTEMRSVLAELAPVLRRALRLEPAAVARFRTSPGKAAVYVRLPFGVLVARTVDADASTFDVVVPAGQTLEWLDGVVDDPPLRRDADWRAGLPPTSGWVRLDTVPDQVVRELVRKGATTLAELAEREGAGTAQPRAEVSDALLDSVVLSVTGDGRSADISLRMLSAVTRMGFLPRQSSVAIDLAGRWVRVAAPYGSVFAERPGGLAFARS